MLKIIFFFQKKRLYKKICVSTLPKILRPVTRNTLIFDLAYGLIVNCAPHAHIVCNLALNPLLLV